MSGKHEPPPPLVCIPSAVPPEQRPAHSARTRRLFDEAALERWARPDGYDFVFDAAELEEVARFVALERLCCPFLSFDIELSPGADRLHLRLHGPPGTREIIEAEILG